MSHDSQKLVVEWAVEIEGRLKNPYNSHATRRPSMDSNIEKYPSIFGKWESWDDFGASYIPETQKWIFVACMKHYFGFKVRSYLSYMQEKVDLAWSYYRGVDDQFRTAENSKRFIEHLLVNSCFFIFSLILLSGEELKDSWINEITRQDNPRGLSRTDIENITKFMRVEPMRTCCYMFTMNYQIPWFVIEVVYTELSNLSNHFVTPIHKIAYLFLRNFRPDSLDKFDQGGTVPEGGFKHLVHIFHWSRTHDGKYVVDISTPNKLIGHFHIPSATELQLSQTVLKKDEDGSFNVSYSDRRISGVMQVTPWHFLRSSTQLFESLIRFEEQYMDCGIPFMAYIACMACLLKTEGDVRVLRVNDIIPSTSFDDKAVLRYVQELRTLIDDNLVMPNELMILEEKVMAHYKKRVSREIGDFKKRYCSNTWIIISVIAGILLFVLTLLQTIYGTLSYYKQ